MDGGQHRHAHAGGLLRGIGLGAAHLTHHKDVRVEAQADIHQRDLIDPLTLIFTVAGQGVDHRVDHLTVFLPHQLQLTGAVLDGEDAFAVGYGSQQPACRRGLTGGGGASHADGDPIAQKYGKPVQHFLCGCAAAQQILTAEIVAVDDSDGGGNAHILIHHGGLHSGNTGVAGQMPCDQRTGVVQHHAGGVEHSPDDGKRVFRRIEVFRELFASTVRILHLDIPPRVDVDLLNAVGVDIAGQEAELRHLGIDGVHQLCLRHACYGDTPVLQVLGDVAHELFLGVLAAPGDECGVGAGDVLLHLLQHGIEVPALCRRGKEQVVRPSECANVGVQGPLRRVVHHYGDDLRLRGDLIFRRVPPLCSCGKDRAVSLFTKSHIKTPPQAHTFSAENACSLRSRCASKGGPVPLWGTPCSPRGTISFPFSFSKHLCNDTL